MQPEGRRYTPQLKRFHFEVCVNDFARPPFWIIGPRSYLSDRAVPQLEISVVPAREMAGGCWKFSGRPETRTTDHFLTQREKIFHPFTSRKSIVGSDSRYHFDARKFGMGNWSHFLNQVVPISVLLSHHLRRARLPPPVIITDKDISPGATQVLEALGLDFLPTSRSVIAPIITMDASNPSALQQWTRDAVGLVAEHITNFAQREFDRKEKIFLNRKSNRSIINNSEILNLLEQRGFEEVFMEDLPASEQFNMLMTATDIVAIHGAALAPLLFRKPSHGHFCLTEIGSPGHVVPFFRQMVYSLPCTYRFVRGVPNPRMAADAFRECGSPSMNFTRKYSLHRFRVDPASLSFALESACDPNFPLGSIEAHACSAPEKWTVRC